MGGSHTSIVRWTKQDTATLEVSPVVLRSPWKLLWPWECYMSILDLHEVGRTKIVLHKDTSMGGSHASTERRTKQNAATLKVSLVVLGPPWGPLWLWVCYMPVLD